MQKWEYWVSTPIFDERTRDAAYITLSGQTMGISSFLDHMGSQGWRLVAATLTNDPIIARHSSVGHVLFFERPRQEPPPDWMPAEYGVND